MRKVIVLLVVMLIPASLFAQSQWWRNRQPGYRDFNMFELTPYVGYRYGGTIYAGQSDLFNQNVDLASAANFGVNFAIPVGSLMKVELMVDRQNTHFTNGNGLFSPNQRLGGIDVTYFQGGLQIPFAVSPAAQPYFAISAGVANLNPHVSGASSATRFAAGVGIGVKVPINRNVGIKIEERGFFTSLSNYGGGGYYSDYYGSGYGYNRDLYQGETNVGVFFRF